MILTLLNFLAVELASADCWQDAAKHHGVSLKLLHAIAKTESSHNPNAIARSPNGSIDVGIMQINSSNFKALSRYGITPKQLLNECVNVFVGAWILSEKFRTHGNTWQAVGAYNAKTISKRKTYAWKVFRNLYR